MGPGRAQDPCAPGEKIGLRSQIASRVIRQPLLKQSVVAIPRATAERQASRKVSHVHPFFTLMGGKYLSHRAVRVILRSYVLSRRRYVTIIERSPFAQQTHDPDSLVGEPFVRYRMM